LKLVCKTSLKANQLIDIGDIEGFQKMEKAYNSLMKSGNFTALQNKTDTKEQIDLLADKLKGMLCHVNLIPLNEVEETGLFGSNRKRASEIAAYLENRGIPATVRRELGADINAACGQLRLGEQEKNK
jgi:23S rRNA (adenine2503-C2)-methyltransferase